MRRFLFGVVIASATAALPAWAFGGDREIAKAVMAELQQHKAAGNLKGFDLDMRVEDGVIYLEGQVASRAQRTLVAQAAASSVGVGNLVNNIKVVPPTSKQTGEAQPVPQSSGIKPVARKVVPKPAETQPEKLESGKKQSASAKTEPAKSDQAVRPVSGRRPAQPLTSDASVTDMVIAKLQTLKSSGELRGFELDVSTVSGDLWLKGRVASQAQKNLVLESARRVRGVKRVVDDIQIVNGGVRTASTGGPAPAMVPPSPMPPSAPMQSAAIPQGSSMPTGPGTTSGPAVPQAFAPASMASMPMQGGYAGGPVPMQGGTAYGMGAPRYDQPNMPSYAWPSYAAYPNYSAVTYPKQYSPSAWPYIGPFYPYPQVPLGWRQVSLEWDDGLWYLDFTSKAH